MSAAVNVRYDVSIVVPCYRDYDNLPELFERLGPVMDDLDRAELILVDDGSPDRTGARAVELARDFRHPTKVVRLLRNFGQQPAVFAGFEEASGRTVVTMDSDLQYPPEQISRLVDLVSAEYPVVSGCRQNRRDPIGRRVLTALLSRWLGRRTSSHLQDFGSMFRAYDESVIVQLRRFAERRRYVPSLVAWLGVPVLEIPVEHRARGQAGSRYTFRPLLDMLLDLITGYTTFPLRLVTAIALCASGMGFLATLIFVIYRIAIGKGASGLASAVALIFFLLGAQLFVLALIGEYIGRVYIETKQRPYYVVSEVSTNQ